MGHYLSAGITHSSHQAYLSALVINDPGEQDIGSHSPHNDEQQGEHLRQGIELLQVCIQPGVTGLVLLGQNFNDLIGL